MSERFQTRAFACRGVLQSPISRRCAPRYSRGVSLIEVLIAVLILSFGLLGLALMQLKGAAFTKDSATRSSAFIQARSMADAMRANPVAATAPASTSTTATCPYCTDTGIPAVADVCPAPAGTSAAASAAIARCDVALWGARLVAAVPGPASSTAQVGDITWDDTIGAYEITTAWTGAKLGETDSGDASYSFTYVP